ncbi:peptidase [Nocardioides silvaticus]|uniref:Peptidase n=1 Tax=Nocardioides silvaticus TaxID=2201891 RepID=A0A316TWT5_9ACTN|nr:peptidase [Nocardioides silvaticus]
MRFNPKARLDRSRVRDVGRSGGGGATGMRIPIPGGIGGKGGIGGLVLVIALVILAQCTGIDILGGGSGGGSASNAPKLLTYDACESGGDANDNRDCARVATENTLTGFWESQDIDGFRPVDGLYTFSGSVSTGCGNASSDVGPFYCPPDESIYLDTRFFDQVLEDQLGGPDGLFVEMYVLAHEYGHHISNVIGDMARVKSQQTGPESPGVRLELQADCFAGMWAKAAPTIEDDNGEVIISEITEQDLKLGLDAAAAVGDDYIQRKTQGQVQEEAWTHGSSAQRQYWFTVGYEADSMEDCATFDVDSVQVPR